LEQEIQNILNQLIMLPPWINGIFFFVSAVLQLTFPPYPGDTIFAFGGYLSSKGMAGGSMLIFLSYWIGTLLSSYGLFELGYWKGEKLLNTRFIVHYFPHTKQTSARKWLLKYGMIILFICKFIPGLNSLLIIFGGVFKYQKIWAYTGIALAALVHNVLFFMAGRAVGQNYHAISQFLASYNKIVLMVTVLVCSLYVFYRFRGFLLKKRAGKIE
jgi:membrane protein DedA with SNARE-associated domain